MGVIGLFFASTECCLSASTCVTEERGTLICDEERVDSACRTFGELSVEISPSSDAFKILLASVHGRLDEEFLIGDGDDDDDDSLATPVVLTSQFSKLPSEGDLLKLRRARSIEGAEPEDELVLLTERD